MSEQHPNTEPTSDEPIFWKDGKQFIRLYYFMPEKHLLDVIMNDEIKASIPEECNDPLEFLPAENDQFPIERPTGGFISFSSHCESPLMWSHYADSHRGVCLCFDFPIEAHGILGTLFLKYLGKSPHQNTKKSQYAILDDARIDRNQLMCLHGTQNEQIPFFTEVFYDSTRPEPSIDKFAAAMEGEIVTYLEVAPTFYTKSEDWQYEKEWRLLINLEQASRFDEGKFYISGITRHLSKIILGSRFPKNKSQMVEIVQDVVSNSPYPNKVRALCLEIGKATHHPTEYKIIVK